MSAHPRDIRRLALQMLYQIDARDGEDLDKIRASMIEAGADPDGRFQDLWSVETLDDPRDHQAAFEKALGAWETRNEADARASSLSPEWPTHRQPVMDRNVIRLCWYEMTRGNVPAKVAVNEAIEMGKQFGTERSAPFLNGVLDKMLKMASGETEFTEPEVVAPALAPENEAAAEEGASADDAVRYPMQNEPQSGDEEPIEFWSSDQ